MSVTEICLGSITGSQGIKGWLKVYSYTDPAEAIFDYSPWILRKGDSEQRIVVKKGQLHGKKLIANLAGVDTRNQADELAGFEIYIAKAALPELDEGDFVFALGRDVYEQPSKPKVVEEFDFGDIEKKRKNHQNHTIQRRSNLNHQPEKYFVPSIFLQSMNEKYIFF